MYYYIYTITNILNNKKYVGYTKNPILRQAGHFNEKTIKSSSKLLYQAMNADGIDNFIFEVIYVSKDKHHTFGIMEDFFINELNTNYKTGFGYNVQKGGVSTLYGETNTNKIAMIDDTGSQRYIYPDYVKYHIGLGWSIGVLESTKKKSSQSKKEKPRVGFVAAYKVDTNEFLWVSTEEYAIGKLNGTLRAPTSGKKYSAESNMKKSNAMKGIAKSEEHKKSLSIARKNQHIIHCCSLHNGKQYDLGNFANHIKAMDKRGMFLPDYKNIPRVYWNPNLILDLIKSATNEDLTISSIPNSTKSTLGIFFNIFLTSKYPRFSESFSKSDWK